MKILLTGATGYLGSSLAKSFYDKGFDIAILKRSSSSKEYLIDYENKINWFDYCSDYESVNECIKVFKPDLVIHLASYYVFDAKPEDIDTLIDSNIRLGMYLLDSMVRNNVQFLLNTGTSFEHFRNADYNPSNLYASTKYAFQNILEYYIQSKKIKAITLKLFDTYGPGDKRKKLLWLLKERVKDGELLKLSKGEQILDFLYIEDLLMAYQKAVELLTNGVLNSGCVALSGGDRVTLKNLIELVEQITDTVINKDLGAYPYRDREIMVPWESFEKLPDWEPQFSLKKGLKLYLNS